MMQSLGEMVGICPGFNEENSNEENFNEEIWRAINSMDKRRICEMKAKMVKRLICSTIMGAALLSGAAMAAGELSVTDKTAFIYPGKDSGYFYAKIENTGDAPAGVDSGQMVLFSDTGDILETSSYVSTYPNRLILNPGEYT